MAYKITGARRQDAIGGMVLLPAEGGRHKHVLLLTGESIIVDELPFGVLDDPRLIVEDTWTRRRKRPRLTRTGRD